MSAQIAYNEMLKIPRDKDKNPLTLEGVIRSMILKSPDMIKWRDDALNMMYCTLGAGIDWNKEGRLVDTTPNNYMNLPPAEGGQGVWARDFGMNDTIDLIAGVDREFAVKVRKRLQKQYDERMAEAVDTVMNIDIRCKTYRPNRSHWYPLSWYSPNLAAPENAQEDFFAGAIEAATIISSLEPDWDSALDLRWRSTMRTKEVAAEILAVLKERQGDIK